MNFSREDDLSVVTLVFLLYGYNYVNFCLIFCMSLFLLQEDYPEAKKAHLSGAFPRNPPRKWARRITGRLPCSLVDALKPKKAAVTLSWQAWDQAREAQWLPHGRGVLSHLLDVFLPAHLLQLIGEFFFWFSGQGNFVGSLAGIFRIFWQIQI